MLCSKELELVPMKNHCTKTYQPVKTTGLTPFHEVRPKALDTQMDNSTFFESDLSSFYTSAQKLLPVSPWINKPPLQSQLYLNLCLSA